MQWNKRFQDMRKALEKIAAVPTETDLVLEASNGTLFIVQVWQIKHCLRSKVMFRNLISELANNELLDDFLDAVWRMEKRVQDGEFVSIAKIFNKVIKLEKLEFSLTDEIGIANTIFIKFYNTPAYEIDFSVTGDAYIEKMDELYIAFDKELAITLPSKYAEKVRKAIPKIRRILLDILWKNLEKQ